MKKILYRITLVGAALFLAVGCHTQLNEEISALKTDVEMLEDYVDGLNKSYASLSDLVETLEQKDFIKKVEQLADGSYRISFVSGKQVVLTDGKDGEKPIIGIKYDAESGTYLWTIRDGEKGVEQWIYDSTGKRIRATAVTPKFRVTDGHFEYSYDEKNWVVSGVSVGESGSSVFNSVTVDEYFVTFSLVDGTVFQLPTQKGFDEMSSMCDTINTNLIAYQEILNSLDSNMFIQSVTKIEEGGKITGYDLVLESGKKLMLRTGKDSSEEIELGVSFDLEMWETCWTYRKSGSSDFSFILYNGQKLPVEAEDSTPVIGVKDSAGVYYFTVTIGHDATQIMVDGNGNPVKASPVRFFDKVEEVSDTIKVTLTSFTGSPKVVNFSKQVEFTPCLVIRDTASGVGEFVVAAGCDRSFIATVDSIPSSQIAKFKYELVSSALDSAYVKSVTVATDTVKRASGTWAVNNKVTFISSSSAVAGKKTRVAVFLSWDNHTIMKVAEFVNQ